jgi:CRISPR-associated protein (TIGR03984 family)
MRGQAMNRLECNSFSTDDIEEDLQKWLQTKAVEHQLTYLLAHAEDGVIWGRFDQGSLITAEQVFSQLPKLRLITLQQCRVFGQAGEVLLWKSQNNWKARFIGNPACDRISEEQVLWGTHKVEEKNGFTLVADGSEGLHHAVPRTGISFADKEKRPLRLIVHHYVAYDETTGLARIAMSRLVDLKPVKVEKEK